MSGVVAASVAAGVWALIGVVLLAQAARRCRAIITAYDEALARSDRRLAEEDATADRVAPEATATEG